MSGSEEERERIAEALLSERIGFRAGENLAGQVEQILTVAKRGKAEGESRMAYLERIQYVVDRLQDHTGKGEQELTTNVAVHLDRILNYSDYYPTIIEIRTSLHGLQASTPTEEPSAAEEQSPVVKVMNVIITQAIKEHADRIGLVRQESDLQAYFVVKGQRREMVKVPAYFAVPLFDAFKLLASINPAIVRGSATGRARVAHEGILCDIEVDYDGVHNAIYARVTRKQ
jgi:type II secretory ATPase GspE/PulE/Tfp pilus assembly ATPase PilB-like protein